MSERTDCMARDPRESPNLAPEKIAPVSLVSWESPIHIRPLGPTGFEVALFVPAAATEVLFAAAEAFHSNLADRYRQVCEALVASTAFPQTVDDASIPLV